MYHKPEQIIQIIERAIWGNTVMEATQKYLLKQMAEIQHIPELTALLSTVLPADLPVLVEAMTVQLDRLSAASTDILEMMEAVPDLVNIVRYGNVRNLDFSKVGDMLEAMIARILAGGVLVCINIDEEAAGDLLNKLVATDYALSILNREELNLMWRNFIGQVRSSANVPSVWCYASERISQWNDCMTKDLQDSNSQVAVEMWRYDPRKLSKKKMVDELSLALSLREDADERVEEAVEEMLNNLWRKIDGNRD